MLGSAKIFAGQFRPVEGGYLYFFGRWSRGYFVSQAEYQALWDRQRRLTGWKAMFMVLGALLTVELLTILGSALLGVPLERAPSWPVFALCFAMMGYFVWETSAPYRVVRSREPVAPKRSQNEVEGDMARALTWPVATFVIVISIWFCFLCALVAWTSPLIGVPLLLIFGTVTYMNGRIIYRKWSARSA